jgi:hypothetical protein
LVHPSGHRDQQEPEWVENSLRRQCLLSRARTTGRTVANSGGSSFRTIRGRRIPHRACVRRR